MDVIYIFAIISGIIFLGYLSEWIFKKTNIPDVLFLIGTGIALRYYFKIVTPESFVSIAGIFTTFALVFLLFQGALSIDFRSLIKVLPKTLSLTIVHFLLTIAVVTLITYGLFQSWTIALLCGMVLGGTSSAVVIPLIQNISIRERFGNVLTLESAITDVLGIISVITLLQILETGQIVASGIFKSVLSSFSMAIIVATIFGMIWIVLMSKFEELIDMHILTIGLVVGLYAFIESPFVSASGAIGALTFGLILGNSRSILGFMNKNKDEQIEKRAARFRSHDKKDEILDLRANKRVLSNNAKVIFSEISFFLKIFFFVYLGILIEFSDPFIFVWGFIITFGIYLIRPFAVKMVFLKDKDLEKDRLFLESLIPKGLAAAVLAQLSVQSEVLNGAAANFVNVVLSVVVISIIFTSIFIFLAEKNLVKGFFNKTLYPVIKK
ncbi:MAG: cation:proton antiporter [Candidatus Woesearchaeota archaeon]|jgi:cell volume regulation protein A|nr:cation:proton antiporter [Candidatus Woesearchaeota archaeon]